MFKDFGDELCFFTYIRECAPFLGVEWLCALVL